MTKAFLLYDNPTQVLLSFTLLQKVCKWRRIFNFPFSKAHKLPQKEADGILAPLMPPDCIKCKLWNIGIAHTS